MRSIVYDVATSLDGYIAGPAGDVSQFPHTGDHAEAYLNRLQSYDTVLMGRRTYEFGYAHGLVPGQRAYPHMHHLIFSSSIDLPDDADVQVVHDHALDEIDRLRAIEGADIYVCGGGEFAGYLLSQHRIDKLRLKIAPIILGEGVSLFGGQSLPSSIETTSVTQYVSGVVLAEYQLVH